MESGFNLNYIKEARDMSESDFFRGTKMGEASEFEKSLGIESDYKPMVPKPLSLIQDEGIEKAPFPTEMTEEKKPVQEKNAIQTDSQAHLTDSKKESSPKESKSSTTEITSDEYAQTIKSYKIGDIINGQVVSVGRNILVDIEYKAEGIIEPEEISTGDKIKVGDTIAVMVMKLENKEGNPMLSKRRADLETAWKEAFQAFKSKDNLNAMVCNAVQGGLVVDFKGIRGFIPASQVLKSHDEELTMFVDKVLPIRVMEIDRKRKKIVFSHRIAAQAGQSELSQKIWTEIEAGQVREGIITNVKRFGVFVDLGGGVEGLVHVSDLAWKRIEDASAVFKPGQKVQVFVLGIDQDHRKISLGIKQLLEDPWVDAEKKYPVGKIVTGKVARITAFGAFIELDSGIEALIHISELSKQRVEKVENILKKDDLIRAKIIRVNSTEQRIGLSMKDTEFTEEEKSFSQYKSTEEKNRKEVTLGDILTS